MLFSWDPQKDLANASKHGVSFSEACQVFGDPLSLTIESPVHPGFEQCYGTLGRVRWRSPSPCSTQHEAALIRIISARAPTPFERREYEEGHSRG